MSSRPSHRSWSTKRYILAALAGTLVISLVVIAVSIVLSPAEIYFTVTDATTNSSDTSVKKLNLVVTANNTSHRAWVKYCSVIVYLNYNADAVVKGIRLNKVNPPSWQSPWSTASINLSASLQRDLLRSDFAGRGPNATLISVLLDTVVMFRYGRVYTRPYNIRVLCDPADYFGWNRRSLPISCRED